MGLRLSAAGIFLLGALGLLLHSTLPQTGHIRAGMFCFYTNLSNLAVLLYELALAIVPAGGVRRLLTGSTVALAMTLCIYVTHLVYHFVLVPDARRQGKKFADFGGSFGNLCVHYGTPWLVVLQWVLWGDKSGLTVLSAVWWLVLPLAYFAYAMLRARTGKPSATPGCCIHTRLWTWKSWAPKGSAAAWRRRWRRFSPWAVYLWAWDGYWDRRNDHGNRSEADEAGLLRRMRGQGGGRDPGEAAGRVPDPFGPPAAGGVRQIRRRQRVLPGREHGPGADHGLFSPIVDDPFLYGQIAAANAISDVYAMGGEPKLALNILCLPESMTREMVQELLRGGYDKAYEAGAIITGGHTIHGAEPFMGWRCRGSWTPGAF